MKTVSAFILVTCLAGLPACGASASEGIRFEEQVVRGLGRPDVQVVNETDLTVTVDVAGPEKHTIVVPPRSQRSQRVPMGVYEYVASAPGVQGTGGAERFDEDRRYTLVFVLLDASGQRAKPAPSALFESKDYAGVRRRCEGETGSECAVFAPAAEYRMGDRTAAAVWIGRGCRTVDAGKKAEYVGIVVRLMAEGRESAVVDGLTMAQTQCGVTPDEVVAAVRAERAAN